MKPGSEPLHLLPWYVSGRLGAKERRAIEAHLQECPDCRAEVAHLSSMMTSVRAQHRVDHITAGDLVLLEEDPALLPPARRASIESHLRDCGECADDLRALQKARELASQPAEIGPVTPVSRRQRMVWLAGASAAALLVALVLWPLSLPPDGTQISGNPELVFASPRRSAESGVFLQGTGPWKVRVLLPFGAQSGNYRVEIRPTQEAASSFDAVLPVDGEQSLRWEIPSLPHPGTYRLSVTPDPPGSGETYHYSFVLSPASDPPSPR